MQQHMSERTRVPHLDLDFGVDLGYTHLGAVDNSPDKKIIREFGRCVCLCDSTWSMCYRQ